MYGKKYFVLLLSSRTVCACICSIIVECVRSVYTALLTSSYVLYLYLLHNEWNVLSVFSIFHSENWVNCFSHNGILDGCCSCCCCFLSHVCRFLDFSREYRVRIWERLFTWRTDVHWYIDVAWRWWRRDNANLKREFKQYELISESDRFKRNEILNPATPKQQWKNSNIAVASSATAKNCKTVHQKNEQIHKINGIYDSSQYQQSLSSVLD